jgi:hypothetical protein
VKRIWSMGICLVAVFATSAVVAASASAEAPEFGRCLKLASEKVGKTKVYHGGYSNGTCTTASEEKKGKYEWYPGVVKTHFTTKIKEGTKATLETVGDTKVTCTGETSTGEYTGPKTEGNMVLTLTGCESGGYKASSAGAAEGEVVTNPTECELGVVKKGYTPAKQMLGLSCAEEAQFAWIKWHSIYGEVELCIRGWWFFSTTANYMHLPTMGLRSVQSKGRQKIERFEEGPLELLESTLNEGPFEQIGLTLTTIQTNEETIEANSVA